MILDNGLIKITDFGIARFSRASDQTITEKAIGSVHYISPEQARGEITDEKADIYSVGVMMYEMLSGTQVMMTGTAFRFKPNESFMQFEVKDANLKIKFIEK